MVERDEKFPDDITLKNVVVFITFVKKDDRKFYPQIFLGKGMYFYEVRKNEIEQFFIDQK